MSGKVRNSNLELLRIFSMLLIVIAHSMLYGLKLQMNTPSYSADLFWYNGSVGVNCFVLISGYFSINQKISLKRMLKLWVTVFTYSFAIYVAVCCFSASSSQIWNFKHLFDFCFPVVSATYWFISTYILLMLLSPFLNRYLQSLDRESTFRYLGALTILLVLFPSIFRAIHLSGSLGLFVLLYSIGAAIRRHVNLGNVRPRYCFIAALLVLFLMHLVHFLAFTAGNLLPVEVLKIGKGIFTANFASLTLSVCLFMGFASWKIESHTWINRLSACTLAVY